MDTPDRILAKRQAETASLAWRGQLPRELCETAARRLGILGLLTAASLVLFAACHTLIGYALRDRTNALLGLGTSLCAIVLSLLMFGLTRWRRDELRLLLSAGLAYQLVMAVLLGTMDNLATQQHLSQVRGWSGLAVWIFIFAVFIPSTPARTLWVSIVIALLDPLTMLLDTAFGVVLPPPAVLPQLFAPTMVAVATAAIAARINYRAAKRLREARELGSYRLVELLGKGGMGEVWRAEHRMLARPAAIKLIRAEILATDTDSAEEVRRRFEREAQATALMQSQHTIQVYDFGVADDGSFYYVMELLEGLNLQELVKQHGPMPPARAVHCLLGVCDSLAEAHAGGLIHRDIKPSNIFLCRRGLDCDCVKVLDFGLVTAVAREADPQGDFPPSKIAGTPAYLAPEIIEGARAIDGRADLYALGCVAYFLLTGSPVFHGDSATAVVLHHLRDEAPPLRKRTAQPIPDALEQLVHACLQKDPARRPQTAADLRRRLAAVELEAAWTPDAASAWWQTAWKATSSAAAGAVTAETAPPTIREGARPGPG